MTEDEAQALYEERRDKPEWMCNEGREYCSDKASIENAWNRCTNGGFLYTWLHWFCEVDANAIDEAIGYKVCHYGATQKNVSLEQVAIDLKAAYTYWGERIT